MKDHDEVPADEAAEENGKDEFPNSIPSDVPEADALEQSREWNGHPKDGEPAIPVDVPEADAIEQSQDATGGEEEEER